jgi:hypothetical protein
MTKQPTQRKEHHVANAPFTKRQKDRAISRAANLYNEMKSVHEDDIWAGMDPDDIAKRLVTMNCHYHGFNELSLKRMPAIAQHEVAGLRIETGRNVAPLRRELRRPLKVPAILLIANAKSNGVSRYDDIFGRLSSGKSADAPFLLPSPAGEMMGPAYQVLLNLQQEITSLSEDQSKMGNMLRKIMPASKSVRAVCSVFPVVRHFLSPEMAVQLEGVDLTKARGDVHSISRTVDMGEMIQLSLKVEAYMKHRVPTD